MATPSESIVALPKAETLRRLALSPTGFVFDPVTGNSFSVNETGQAILQILRDAPGLAETVEALTAEYEVEPLVAERDVMEFVGHLRGLLK